MNIFQAMAHRLSAPSVCIASGSDAIGIELKKIIDKRYIFLDKIKSSVQLG